MNYDILTTTPGPLLPISYGLDRCDGKRTSPQHTKLQSSPTEGTTLLWNSLYFSQES